MVGGGWKIGVGREGIRDMSIRVKEFGIRFVVPYCRSRVAKGYQFRDCTFIALEFTWSPSKTQSPLWCLLCRQLG